MSSWQTEPNSWHRKKDIQRILREGYPSRKKYAKIYLKSAMFSDILRVE